MKFIYILIVMLLLGNVAVSQQITVSGSVNIMLPTGSASITQAAALTVLQQKFPTYGYTSGLVTTSSPNYTYCQVNGNILRFLYEQADGRGPYLANQKLLHDAVGNEGGMNAAIQYTSSVSTMPDGVSVLLMYYTGGGVSSYDFVCCNPYNTDILVGSMDFAVADKNTVTTTLNSILSSIYFIPRNVTFTMSNNSSSAVIVTFINGPSNLSVTLQPGTANSTLQVLSGKYSVLAIRPAIAGSLVTRTMTLGTRPSVTAPGNGFSNVIIAPGSSDLKLTVK